MTEKPTKYDYMKFWDAAAPMIMSDLNIRNELKSCVKFTEATIPVAMDAVTKLAVMTLAAKIEEDRIEGPITENEAAVYAEMANLKDEVRSLLRQHR